MASNTRLAKPWAVTGPTIACPSVADSWLVQSLRVRYNSYQLDWSFKTRVHLRLGKSPATFLPTCRAVGRQERALSEESIFLDESGDFGSNSKYYLVTLVFHDQGKPIADALAKLNRELGYLGFPSGRAIHTGPIVRRENEYMNMGVPERKRIFTKLYAFTRNAGVTYKTFSYRKSEYPDRMKLKARFARDLSLFIDEHVEYFASFDKVIAYYDNGQSIITETINAVFAAKFFEVDFRRVLPHEYRLFQSADLICTLELLRMKDEASELSKSEIGFFGSAGKIRRDYLKQLDKMRFGG